MRYLFPGEFWAYRVVAADRPLTDYGGCADFVALWRAKRIARIRDGDPRAADPAAEPAADPGVDPGPDNGGAEALPARQDFSFDDFRGWHGWITIDEVTSEPFDMHCRLFGTQVAALHGADQTGVRLRTFLDNPEERPFYEDYLACHDRAARDHAFVRGVGSMQHRGRALGAEWIGLPCADDGRAVTHFISLMQTFSLGLLREKSEALKALADPMAAPASPWPWKKAKPKRRNGQG